MGPACRLLTVAEFLDACPNDRRHYQLFDGVIVAMPAPAIPHQIIAAALTAEIGLAVRANLPGCSVHSQGGIAPRGVSWRDHFETDVTVTCASLADSYRGIIAAPLLIVEILSPSTDRDDVFVKLPAYQRIASLQEILYVETGRVGATPYTVATPRDGWRWRSARRSGCGSTRSGSIFRSPSCIEVSRVFRHNPARRRSAGRARSRMIAPAVKAVAAAPASRRGDDRQRSPSPPR